MVAGSDLDYRNNPSGETAWHELRIGAKIVWTRDGTPIRDIAPRSKTPVGKYNSRKAGRFLAHRSRGHGYVGGEKLALMRYEIEPLIFDLRTYHIRFDLVVNGVPRSYIPPMLLSKTDGGLTVQHLVYRPFRSDEQALLAAVRNVCFEVGWNFELITEQHIAPTPRIRDNIISIQAERYAAFAVSDLLAVMDCLNGMGGTAPLAHVAACLGQTRPTYPIVKAMMCHGHLTLPLEERIDCDTLVSITPPRPTRQSELLS